MDERTLEQMSCGSTRSLFGRSDVNDASGAIGSNGTLFDLPKLLKPGLTIGDAGCEEAFHNAPITVAAFWSPLVTRLLALLTSIANQRRPTPSPTL
jgi:hypothetical protein